MIVKHQKPIRFINTCNCIVDERELEKAILWYSAKPVLGTKKIFLHGEYPAVSIHKEKIHVHRLLMMYWMRRRLSSNEYVHHLNHEKLCALQSNLSVMIGPGHQSLHNKGKKFSYEHRRKISEANRARSGKVKLKKRRQIPINELKTLLSEGKSINFIAKHFGVDWSTIKQRINENPDLLEVGN